VCRIFGWLNIWPNSWHFAEYSAIRLFSFWLAEYSLFGYFFLAKFWQFFLNFGYFSQNFGYLEPNIRLCGRIVIETKYSVFGRMVGAEYSAIRYSAEYQKPLFGTPLIRIIYMYLYVNLKMKQIQHEL
jgi:hypothetical protein